MPDALAWVLSVVVAFVMVAILADGRGRKIGAKEERRLIALWLAHVGETSGAVVNAKDLAVSVERGDHEVGAVTIPERKA